MRTTLEELSKSINNPHDLKPGQTVIANLEHPSKTPKYIKNAGPIRVPVLLCDLRGMQQKKAYIRVTKGHYKTVPTINLEPLTNKF